MSIPYMDIIVLAFTPKCPRDNAKVWSRVPNLNILGVRTGGRGVCAPPDELKTAKPLSRMARPIRPKSVSLGIPPIPAAPRRSCLVKGAEFDLPWRLRSGTQLG